MLARSHGRNNSSGLRERACVKRRQLLSRLRYSAPRRKRTTEAPLWRASFQLASDGPPPPASLARAHHSPLFTRTRGEISSAPARVHLTTLSWTLLIAFKTTCGPLANSVLYSIITRGDPRAEDLDAVVVVAGSAELVEVVCDSRRPGVFFSPEFVPDHQHTLHPLPTGYRERAFAGESNSIRRKTIFKGLWPTASVYCTSTLTIHLGACLVADLI